MNQPSRGGCSAGVGRETYWLRPTKPTAKLALQIVASDTRQHDSSTYVFNMCAQLAATHAKPVDGWSTTKTITKQFFHQASAL